MKKLKWISLLFVMALGFSVMAACTGGGETFTVTFYGRDGETVKNVGSRRRGKGRGVDAYGRWLEVRQVVGDA